MSYSIGILKQVCKDLTIHKIHAFAAITDRDDYVSMFMGENDDISRKMPDIFPQPDNQEGDIKDFAAIA